MSGDSHPARKIDREELMRELAMLNEDVPAVTTKVIAAEFSEVDPQTVRNNLDDLADEGEVCRFNDGRTKFYWFPRDNDEGGSVEYSELIDDSVDWYEVDITNVPKEVAESIAEERLPYYRPRSFWSLTTNASQMGIMASIGLIILGIGGAVSDTLGLGQSSAVMAYQIGLLILLLSLVGYVISLTLDYLAANGYVTKEPLSNFRDSSEAE